MRVPTEAELQGTEAIQDALTSPSSSAQHRGEFLEPSSRIEPSGAALLSSAKEWRSGSSHELMARAAAACEKSKRLHEYTHNTLNTYVTVKEELDEARVHDRALREI